MADLLDIMTSVTITESIDGVRAGRVTLSAAYAPERTCSHSYTIPPDALARIAATLDGIAAQVMESQRLDFYQRLFAVRAVADRLQELGELPALPADAPSLDLPSREALAQLNEAIDRGEIHLRGKA